MSLTSADKKSIVKESQRSKNDTGSPEVQVSILTSKIQYLTEHFKVHKKDIHSKYGLQTMVNKRRKLLQYLKRKNPSIYQTLITRLELRDSY